jgi:hypothetical protein
VVAHDEASSKTRWLAIAGFAASLAAWIWQPGKPIYSDMDRIFYLPDADLGWILVEPGLFSLGVDLLGLAALGLLATLFIARFGEGRVAPIIEKLALALVFFPALLVLFGGRFPDGATLEAPSDRVVAPEGLSGGLEGLEAGRWESRGEYGRGIIARVPAGGEVFDTRFVGLTQATVSGDPSDLRQPLAALVVVDSASADTGVDGRSKGARDYLQVESYPKISFELTELVAAAQVEPGVVEFSAAGKLDFMGEAHATPVTGTLRRLDEQARERLGIRANAAFSLDTSFDLRIADTTLKAKAGSFDGDSLEIGVDLVFTPSPPP